jgi:predicted RNase H-like HicB family nuclease
MKPPIYALSMCHPAFRVVLFGIDGTRKSGNRTYYAITSLKELIMHYQALIEEWPSEYMAYFRSLPGCFASAPIYEEAQSAAPTAITTYLHWLKSNGLLDEMDAEVEVVVKERLAAKDGEIGPRFEADLAPVSDEEIDNALNIAAVARTDLIELYERISSKAREQVLDAGGWSVNAHMAHIIEAELWYVSRLSDEPQVKPFSDLSTDLPTALFDVAMDTELALRGLTEEQRSRVYTHEGEEWTAAKVLRRLVGHLREHYPWIQQLGGESL